MTCYSAFIHARRFLSYRSLSHSLTHTFIIISFFHFSSVCSQYVTLPFARVLETSVPFQIFSLPGNSNSSRHRGPTDSLVSTEAPTPGSLVIINAIVAMSIIIIIIIVRFAPSSFLYPVNSSSIYNYLYSYLY